MRIVDAPLNVGVRFGPIDVSKMCPFRDERDDGTVIVSWNTGTMPMPRDHTLLGQSFELHELAAFLRSFMAQRISHEAYVRVVVNELDKAIGSGRMHYIRCESTWQTAGGPVVVAYGG